jgi:hypothetical protein
MIEDSTLDHFSRKVDVFGTDITYWFQLRLIKGGRSATKRFWLYVSRTPGGTTIRTKSATVKPNTDSSVAIQANLESLSVWVSGGAILTSCGSSYHISGLE